MVSRLNGGAKALSNAVRQHVGLNRSSHAAPALTSYFVRGFSESATQTSEGAGPSQFQETTVGDLMGSKNAETDGAWLWCSTTDTVFDAVKAMTSHNVGALLVMKDGGDGAIAGIITERDYLRKIIVQGRSSKSTKVGDIMTEENKLITVSPSTKVLKAMELMSDFRIRHIPVCEGLKMKGMLSIGDVVKAVVREHRQEVDRLNDYIRGSY